jgi:hypothetical protein
MDGVNSYLQWTYKMSPTIQTLRKLSNILVSVIARFCVLGSWVLFWVPTWRWNLPAGRVQATLSPFSHPWWSQNRGSAPHVHPMDLKRGFTHRKFSIWSRFPQWGHLICGHHWFTYYLSHRVLWTNWLIFVIWTEILVVSGYWCSLAV